VRVTDGGAIWSQTYDRTLDDVFAVQDEIAHAVVKELRRTLLGEADDSHASREARAEVAQVVASRRSENPEAVRLLLQARHVIGRRTQADLVTAIRILEQAIALEPSFARAWTELSRTHFSFVSLELGDRELHLARAREALDRALALEPELADAHAHRAYMAMVGDVDLAGAAMALEPALRLEPNNPAVLGIAGILAAIHGRFKEAIAVQQRIVEMDPLQPVAYRNLALMWSASGQHDVALDVIQKAIELAPESIGIRSMHSRILARLGRIDEALSEADRERDDSVRTYARALALSLGGRRVEAEQELALLIRDHGGDSAAQIASVYGALGETDSAFSWLDRGWDARDPGVLEIQYNRELDSLHADPRWAELLRRVGLQS